MLVTDASVGRVLGGAQVVQEKNRESFLLSKNVCWCWLRMLLLAESVAATMLDPQALGTAFQKTKNKSSEWNCTSSPSLNNAADYKGGGVASPQASWIFGTARIHQIMARHGTARDIPVIRESSKELACKISENATLDRSKKLRDGNCCTPKIDLKNKQ